MTSMSNFVGEPLIWVRRRRPWDLIASDNSADNSAIASFPVETSGSSLGIGLAGKRWKKAKAIIPDGTGTLYLNEDGQNIVIYSAEQGPRLATYRDPWLVFPDERRFNWSRAGYLDSLRHLRYALKHPEYYGAGVWTDAENHAYVVILDGARNHRAEIWPAAAELRDPEVSLLLVLGLYNIFIENRQGFFEGPPKSGLPGLGG